FRIQNRALMNTMSDEDFQPSSFEARVRRCRLSFTGHAVSTKLTYYLQLSFARGDMDWTVTDATSQNVSPNVVRDAMIFYKPGKNFVIGFGQGKLPGNRQRVNSSGALQFYDRSLVNANFTTDRDFGVFLTYKLRSPGTAVTLLKGAVSSGEGRNSNQSNYGLAYTGRIEVLPLGEFSEGGDYFEGDVAHEQKPKLSIGGGYMFDDMAVRTGGQLGKDLYGQKSFSLYFADLMFKYRGFCFASEYMRRDADNPYVIGTDKKTRFIATGDGINNQVSYCTKNMWEFALRQTLISPHSDVLVDFNQAEQYGIGITKYLNKHKVKAQMNLLYNKERNLARATDVNSYYTAVFQLELGI
ncbi:MAG: porin, partial [Bacteroidia bacterium]|nr:porin [Bacteroidia bacterium]